MRADLAAIALAVAAGIWLLGLAAAALPRSAAPRRLSASLALLGSLAVAVGGGAGLGTDTVYEIGSWQELGAVSIRLDGVAGFYLLLTGIVGAAIALALALRARDSEDATALRGVAALVNGLLLAVSGIFVSANVFLFLLCWESMAILFYLSVNLGRREAGLAALWTFDFSKVGGALMLAAFLLLFSQTGSFQFADFARLGPQVSLVARSVAFVLFFAGFGVKIGMLPVQVWLPRAYPQAPTLLSALLAAVVFNVGLYGLERSLFEWLGRPAEWWGILLLAIGGLSAFGGIVYATAQVQLKAFLAFSSMENAGFILVALGVALLARADGLPLLAGLGLVAALYQVTVHAFAKALLFIETDGIERACGDSNMERIGGLARPLPGVTLLFLAGALTFAAMPPFGGLTSEWLIIESLMQGFRLSGTAAGLTTAVAGALLALTSGIAIVAFVKAFGISFLGLNRGAPVRQGAWPAFAAGLPLALGCLGLGVGAPWLISLLASVAAPAAGAEVARQVSTGALLLEPAFSGFSSISPTELGIVLPIAAALPLIIIAILWNRTASRRRVPVWNSGAVPFSRATQYTALGFSNPVRIVFGKLLQPAREAQTVGSLPVDGTYATPSRLLLEEYVYDPLVRFGLWANRQVRRLQSGSIGLYLLYLLVGLTLVLIVVPLVH